MVILWLGLAILIYQNFRQVRQETGSGPFFTEVLANPLDANPHVALARLFWDNNLVELSLRELTISEELSEKTNANAKNQVLGDSSLSNRILSLWKNEPEKIRSHYDYWRQKALELPNYRDAHLIAGILASQLSLSDEAAFHLARAGQIDPNHPILKNLNR